jgi:hypothetical protein
MGCVSAFDSGSNASNFLNFVSANRTAPAGTDRRNFDISPEGMRGDEAVVSSTR